MSISVPIRVVQRRFGETARRDAWWIQPLVVFLGLSTFLVYSTWAAFQGDHYTLRPVSLAVLLAGDLRRLAAQLVRTEARGVARVAAVLAGAAHPADPGLLPADLLLLPRRVLQGVLGRSAVVHGRRAAHRATGARTRFRSSCRTSIATCCSSRSGSCSSCASMSGRRSGSPIRRRAPCRSASASARSCWPPTCVLLSGYLFGCHSLRHVVGGCVDQLSRAPLGVRRVRLRELPQPPAHAVGVVQPVLGRLL